MERLCQQAVAAVDEGCGLLILSDRGLDARRAPIPALLALSAVHQRLTRDGIRMQTGLLVETGEAREVHDFAALFGFGAAAVNPYLALDTVRALADSGELPLDEQEAQTRYIKAIEEGLLKVMSKMGISTLQSYRGAQIFEAVGLDRALVDRHFTGTPSRLGGIGFAELQREAQERHARGFEPRPGAGLPIGGLYQWRRQGEQHRWNPDHRVAPPGRGAERRLGGLPEVQRRGRRRDPRRWHPARAARPRAGGARRCPSTRSSRLESIVRRFVTGAMSFGSISAEAHETLAIAMNRVGGRSNSGEGGEESRRYVPDANGDLRRSAIKQVASARFGVSAEYLVNADELQIKIAQGAKPGEGGQLPGHKVDDRIARVRCSTPGVTLISPPPHHDIYSIEDLSQLIYDLQSVNPAARIGVKLVSEVGVGTVAAGVTKAGAGCIVISGYEGGTGASPISSIQHAGLPWELGVAEAHQTLVENGMRGRVRLQVDGGMRTGRDVVIAALLGAEEYGMATASLIAMGCVMLRKCHLNTCSVGIATQDPVLREKFQGTPEGVVHFFLFVAREVRELLARLGVRSVDEIIGRRELLRRREDMGHWKARRLDLAPMLVTPRAPADAPRRCVEVQRKDVSDHLDRVLLQRARGTLEGGAPTLIVVPVRNAHRAVGAMLSGEIAKSRGAAGLAGRQHPGAAPGLGGAELRRVPRRRGDARARGRRQRLRGQGTVGRPGHRPSAGRRALPARGERHHREHRALRRHRRRAVRLGARRRALRRPQQRRARRWSRAWATTAAST